VSQKVREAIIVIDAWDGPNIDCEDEFNQVLRHLQDLPWRIHITSREEPRVPIVQCLQYHFQVQDNSADIQNFIERIVDQYILTVECNPLKDADVRSYVVGWLRRKSQGM
jgi:hypothetical protein